MKTSDTAIDFEVIHSATHVDLVKKTIDKSFASYFSRIPDIDVTSSFGSASTTLFWKKTIEEYISNYERESRAYKAFFSTENLEEYEENDDAKSFKSDLKRSCPIIQKTFNAKREELQKWKEDFVFASPKDLFDTFLNFLDRKDKYLENKNETDYSNQRELESFEELADFSDDPDLGMQRVIGAGIQTTVLYSLTSQYFNKSVRRNLYGLHFLTLDIHERMPSRTSEFVIFDDIQDNKGVRGSKKNHTIEHNYWYPYDLFMFYSKYVFDLLSVKLKDLKIKLDVKYRYVYVFMFLDLVTKQHEEAVRTMMGGDQDY